MNMQLPASTGLTQHRQAGDHGQVPATVAFPPMDSPALWDHLCENVTEFLDEAHLFKDTYKLATRVSSGRIQGGARQKQ
jgi:hypothetical protein